MHHEAPVVFPVDFDVGEHVFRGHPINVQFVTDPVIMPAKEEPGCDSGSENIHKHEPRDILHCDVERRDPKFRCCRKGRTIGSRISSLYFPAINFP